MSLFSALSSLYKNPSTVISGASLDALNRYVDISFDPNAYHSTGGAVLASDLQIIFTQNGGTATAAVITSVTNTSGGALAGGENTIRVNINITGSASGVEKIEIKPSAAATIKNSFNVFIAANQTTGQITLNLAYDTDYQAILSYALANGITIPSLDQRELDSQLITDLKTIGAWTEFDVFYQFCYNADRNWALINWRNPGTYNCTEVGSLTWTSLKGVKSAGTGYLNTNYAPSTNGVKYTQNDASLWVKFQDNAGLNSVVPIGARGSISGSVNLGHVRIQPRNGSGLASYLINRDTGTSSTVSNTDSTGLFVVSRAASTTNRLYRNGTELSNNAGASSLRTERNIFICAANGNGTAEFPDTTRSISFAAAGSNLQSVVASATTYINQWVTDTTTVPPITGRVYLLGGQSNMSGYGLVSDLPGYLTGPLARCYVWWNSSWQQLQAGVNANGSSTYFGPIISLAYAESQKYPTDNLYFVIQATGGTDLENDWDPSTGGQYSQMISKWNAATVGMTITGKMGFVWMQGEADAKVSAYATAYQTNESALMTAVFAATGITKAVVGNISSPYSFNSTVRTAKTNNNSGSAYGTGGSLFETSDLNPTSQLHYSSSAYITIGERISTAL